jgi:hypothetical protein
MRLVTIFFVSIILFISCESAGTKVSYKVDPNNHEVVVKEVIQASAYTYLLVNERGSEYWIAVSTLDSKEGDVFHYSRSMEMNNFKSKDLGRTFDKVLFIDNLSKSPIPVESEMPAQQPHQNIKPVITKQDVKIETRDGSIQISELFQNASKYENQIVKVVGKVSKFNTAIMKKNWAHIQDGTDFEGNYDLTVTTADVLQVGDVVLFEGKISLKKDFGSGYFYEVIMEDAKSTSIMMQ